jgi:CheY-like chemotaxis protein
VVLPLQPWVPDVQHAQHVDITPAQTPPLAPRNLLLAEDSPINREVILRQLAKLGHRCEFAEDGEQAWAMLRAPGAGYDALITDGDMPTLDGYALTERIRNWERRHVTARLPILAMTANALHGERERCLAAGMDAYVSKPVNLQQIEQALFELFMPYASVRQLCADDADAIRHVVSTFVSSIGQDVVSFEAAHRAGDVRQLRHLAHRMASGCLQLGEQAAQEALQQVEDAPDLQQMRDAYPAAESALQSALVRARAFLAHRAEEA